MMAVVSIITRYKLRHVSRQRVLIQMAIWLVILLGLIFAQPLYEWLLANHYTDTSSLSLFDVIQITAIVIILYVVTRMRAKVDALEQHLSTLHRELSIKLSER